VGEIFYSGDVACRIGTRAANGRKRLAPVNDRIGVAERRHHQRGGESKRASLLKRSLENKRVQNHEAKFKRRGQTSMSTGGQWIFFLLNTFSWSKIDGFIYTAQALPGCGSRPPDQTSFQACLQ
jgi:hypothetical protein